MNQPLSYVHPGAKVAKTVVLEPFSTIDNNVEIGEGTWVGSNVTIMEGARIGKNCNIYPGAVISGVPQDLKFEGEESLCEIGDNTTIRECVTINRGTKDRGTTKIGSNCLIMAYSHVAHDCFVGNNVILANNVPLGGHAHIDDNAIIGGNSAVQQFTRVGKSAMIGGMCGVVRDIIPFGIAHGNRSVLQGLNLIGLRRKNIPNKEIMALSNAYKDVPISKINEEEAIGRGAMALYDIYDESFVAVSTGTGTACIHHSDGKFNHLGGISVGGGTLQGLSKYLISLI